MPWRRIDELYLQSQTTEQETWLASTAGRRRECTSQWLGADLVVWKLASTASQWLAENFSRRCQRCKTSKRGMDGEQPKPKASVHDGLRQDHVFSRPRGVTVNTLDSESSDRGSNPREAFLARGPKQRPLECDPPCLPIPKTQTLLLKTIQQKQNGGLRGGWKVNHAASTRGASQS